MRFRDGWVFDGTEGHCEVMAALVRRQIDALEAVATAEFADPIDRLVAEFDGAGEDAIAEDPTLARLFPPALPDEKQAALFRRDAMTQQARARLDAAHTVLAAVAGVEDCHVEVPVAEIDAWVMTMSGLRAQWHVELTRSTERLAEATHQDMLRNPTAAAVTEWLGYLIEDALDAHARARGAR